MGIYQYFFPSPDELAVGGIERGLTTKNQVDQALTKSGDLGHPLGDPAIIGHFDGLIDLLGQLREIGYVGQTETTLEIGPQGQVFRSTVKTAPKEGAISKIIGQSKLNVDLKGEVSTKLFEGLVKSKD